MAAATWRGEEIIVRCLPGTMTGCGAPILAAAWAALPCCIADHRRRTPRFGYRAAAQPGELSVGEARDAGPQGGPQSALRHLLLQRAAPYLGADVAEPGTQRAAL